ncbi:hypothetical protein HaLaN_22657 [Haematococcus lacustris]|uniref:Uncharacterized protein n=1 Tax=Haematococcus lacustris TaxID=44745 RepID=A0A6A0A175_HAELA|nr:hypothetical protein HaLaN_22657 [Haematococcus lacustris]
MLAHPHLSLQLQQLDLTGTTILQQLEAFGTAPDALDGILAGLTELLTAQPQLLTLQKPGAPLDTLVAAMLLTSVHMAGASEPAATCSQAE